MSWRRVGHVRHPRRPAGLRRAVALATVVLAWSAAPVASATSTPPAASAVPPTPGTMAVEQYAAGSCSTVGNVALISARPSCLATLRLLNPGAVLLAYTKGEVCQRGGCPADRTSTEFAHDLRLGGRIQAHGKDTFLMQIDNQAWEDAVVANCLRFVRAGWDGCLLDMMGPDSYALPRHAGNGIVIPGSNPPAVYSASAWAALATSLYTYVQSHLPAQVHLVANGLDAPTCAVAPGCAVGTALYAASGLVVDNQAGTDYGAEAENFPCPAKIPPVPCITQAEVSAWSATTTLVPTGGEHIAVIDHQGNAPVDHNTALAVFLLADQDPVHTSWAYCTNAQTDPACQQPDAEYVSYYNDTLAAGGYTWLGPSATDPTLYHSSWTQGDCLVNTGAATSIAVPGIAGQSAYELDGTADTAGAPFVLGPGAGMCWSTVHLPAATSRATRR